ncbi:MAG: tRNA (adenosine(37)-N6)-threonylcarbamoyltransferase complex ATPase subunit type 1 TsaE [Planctomycetota bacterium]
MESPQPLQLHLHDLAATARLARQLAARLRVGDLVALDGPLGSGKTSFVRALVTACGGEPALVASPSYGLLHHYEADPPLVHIDAYRLRDSAELDGLGLDEIVDESVTCVEWAVRMVGLAQRFARAWRCTWDHHPAGGRVIELHGPEPLTLEGLHG